MSGELRADAERLVGIAVSALLADHFFRFIGFFRFLRGSGLGGFRSSLLLESGFLSRSGGLLDLLRRFLELVRGGGVFRFSGRTAGRQRQQHRNQQQDTCQFFHLVLSFYWLFA